ncbi:ABC transporter ATP-binding protein [Saccharopolyspora rectivirgula]|jgi:phospholipid/cholesterol/gamma-HCH transport system ATP-binding protein|uniref:ABC transporter ATP-binding protein n=1 Tax=Saccharopolyspora rectivirgula TaxID=28042 RepID=A0A073B1U5_9PSEU|nr:ABC transporter ATP-binding protein [Saccharopolyspora rectivirgula]KEI45242.1 ABC transporter ATP-binding protein [Saccharopolyspora rectivirgula]
MGVEVVVEGLSKSFGAQTIWRDVTLTLPPGEISVLLGPSGTGKSVFLKSLVGLLRPEQGRVVINGVDICTCSEHELYEVRKLFGVLFQDGALFGSMNLFDNIAFPLREHTRKNESEIRRIVLEKMEMVGLIGAEEKLPGEISGGMRKRAGLARALVLDPEIILFDEPDSGLDPVRTAYLNQLIVDLNAQIDATFLIVTHDINTARTVPDNIGMLFRRNLVMFGPREMLLTSTEPVVEQFLNGRREGPIGMSEEKDAGQLAAEMAQLRDADTGVPEIVPQLQPSNGLPERAAVRRRKDRVMRNLHTLSPAAQQEIFKSLTPQERARYGIGGEPGVGGWPEQTAPTVPERVVAQVPEPPSRPSPVPRNPVQAQQPPEEPSASPQRRRWFGRKQGGAR